MLIPTRQECYHIMYDMKMMDHIVLHSLQVCRVAMFLADSLEADLNMDLVQSAALLHDITKTRSIKTHEDHAQTGKQLVIRLGYTEVRKHSLDNMFFWTSLSPPTVLQKRMWLITRINVCFTIKWQPSHNEWITLLKDMG